MVPNTKEPINEKKNDWSRGIGSNFASEIKKASDMNKDKTTEKKMRETKKISNRARQRKAEANARRKVNEKWERMEETPRYRKAVAKEVCQTTTRKIVVELLDGILLNLNIRSQSKSANVQNRLLRRIVEKRQAQANHKKNGRTEDLTSVHISISCTSRCMTEIGRKRRAV